MPGNTTKGGYAERPPECPSLDDGRTLLLYNLVMDMVKHDLHEASAGTSERQVGALIRDLRTEQQLSIRTLAAKAGFSPSFISQVENGQTSPSIASLEQIAQVLGVTLGQFFQRLAGNPTRIVRADERIEVRSAWSRAKVEALGPAEPGQAIEPLLITLEPEGRSASQPYAHRMDEFAMVLSGTVRLHLDGSEHRLGEGDAVTIPAATLHHWENAAPKPAQVLLVGVRSTR
jgi:transcriptional regulator with XRE-family HTH domain